MTQSRCQHWSKPFLGRGRIIYSYPELKGRDQAIIHIQPFSNIEEGKKDWKKFSGPYLRSLVETTIPKQIEEAEVMARRYEVIL